MLNISVLYANRYKSHHDIYPLKVYKSEIAQLNIKLLFFNQLNANALKSDIIIISSYKAHECFASFVTKNKIEIKNNNYFPIFKLIKDHGSSIIWFDTSDTTGISFPNIFEYVDLYLKQQILNNVYDTENIYYDHYYKKYFYSFWKNERNKIQIDSKALKSKYKKVALGWNMAFSDWKIHGKNRILRGLNIILPSKTNKIDFHCRPLIKRKKNLWFLGNNKGHLVNDHHRNFLINQIKNYNSKYNFPNYNHESLSFKKYTRMLKQTAVVPSPFGLGEICYRDFEILFSGCLMIKPDMQHIKTWPNIYKPMETYLPCKWDFSDLEQKVKWAFRNISKAQSIATAGQLLLRNLLFKENKFSYRFKRIIDKAGHLKNP